MGKKVSITITEQGKNDTSVGKTDNYKQVVIQGVHPLGSQLNVNITDCSEWDLKGELI